MSNHVNNNKIIINCYKNVKTLIVGIFTFNLMFMVQGEVEKIYEIRQCFSLILVSTFDSVNRT